MRAAFGLVGLLVTVGVIVMLMKMYHPADVVNRGAPLKKEAQQWAGQTEDGVRVRDTIRYQPHEVRGKFQGLLVDELTANSPMISFYTLQRDDIIVAAALQGGWLDFKDYSFDESKAFVEHAYQTKGQLTILRNGQRLRLIPTEEGLTIETIGGTPAVVEQPAQEPAAEPAPQPAGGGSALGRQLEGITRPR